MGTTKGQSRGNIYKVAEKAGVSFVTVSRVFNDHPNVSESMRERVFAAARAVGYSPKLVSKPTVLAIVISDHAQITSMGYTQRLLMHMVRVAAERNYFIEFLTIDNLERATKRLIDGMVAVGLTEEQLQRLVRLPNVPVIQTNYKSINDDWNTIVCDYYQETQTALTHLQKEGHEKIALVLDSQQDCDAKERMRAFEDTFSGMKKRRARMPAIFDLENIPASELAVRIKDGGYTACAILTDASPQALLTELTDVQGFSVPENLSIITLEEPGISAYHNPPISTMMTQVEEMAEAAVIGLIELIGGAKITQRTVFPSRLVRRASIAKPTLG